MATDTTSPSGRQRGSEIGPTGRTVAANLRSTRESRRLDLRGLADLLRGVGRYIAPSALSKIENEVRRVESDELMALAAVLNVSPLQLLLPADDEAEQPTGVPNEVTRQEVWAWARGETNLNPHALHEYWTGRAVQASQELEQVRPQLESDHEGMRHFARVEVAKLEAELTRAHDRMAELTTEIEDERDAE